MKLVVVAVVLAASVPAAAESFGGWTLTAPSGYTRSETRDFVMFQKIVAPTFCQFGLYASRPIAKALDAEIKDEWASVVEKGFQVSQTKKQTSKKTKSGIAYTPTTGLAKDPSNNSYRMIHYALVAGNRIGSLLVMSTNEASMTKCATTAATFLDGLGIEQATTQAPPANSVSVVGRWANSGGGTATGYGEGRMASIRREYNFATDGTYRFHSELHTSVGDWILVDETGAWSIAGDKLTVTPKSASIVVRDDKAVKKRTKGTLEKTVYTVSRHYFEGIGEWNLVLTPPAKTNRDGEFAANEKFAKSYLYTDTFKPEWRFAP